LGFRSKNDEDFNQWMCVIGKGMQVAAFAFGNYQV